MRICVARSSVVPIRHVLARRASEGGRYASLSFHCGPVSVRALSALPYLFRDPRDFGQDPSDLPREMEIRSEIGTRRIGASADEGAGYADGGGGRSGENFFCDSSVNAASVAAT